MKVLVASYKGMESGELIAINKLDSNFLVNPGKPIGQIYMGDE